MTEKQPEPYGQDALDAHIDRLLQATREYFAARVLDHGSPLGDSYAVTEAAAAVRERRRELREFVSNAVIEAEDAAR